MKEIFNDIRNKASISSDKACFMPDDTEVIAESRLKQILDEAEAKWESDCCEWKLEDAEANLYVTSCEQRHLIFEDTPEENGYRFCPYCGKKIKVVE